MAKKSINVFAQVIDCSSEAIIHPSGKREQGSSVFQQLLFYCLLVILSFALAACSAKKKTSTAQSTHSETEVEHPSPQILVLDFEIHSNDSVYLVNTTTYPGAMRRREASQPVPTPGDLVVSFLDQEMFACAQVTVSNPLVKRVEYSDDFRNLQTAVIELEKAEFSVRIQYQDCMKKTLIQKVSESTELSQLKIIDVQINNQTYE